MDFALDYPKIDALLASCCEHNESEITAGRQIRADPPLRPAPTSRIRRPAVASEGASEGYLRELIKRLIRTKVRPEMRNISLFR